MAGMMSYLEQFIDAVQFKRKIDRTFRPTTDQISALHKMFTEQSLAASSEELLHMRELIWSSATRDTDHLPMPRLINQCHAVSQSYFERYEQTEFGERLPLYITIGNVFFQGHNVYGLSKSKLRTIVNRGPDAREKLDVHVWLTLSDMSVMDLTIVPTLKARGLITADSDEFDRVLMWDENTPGPFRYEPLLVDNDFLYRVDRIRSVSR